MNELVVRLQELKEILEEMTNQVEEYLNALESDKLWKYHDGYTIFKEGGEDNE